MDKSNHFGMVVGGTSFLHTIQHSEATCEHMVTHLIYTTITIEEMSKFNYKGDCADNCTIMANVLSVPVTAFTPKSKLMSTQEFMNTAGTNGRFSDAMSLHCA